ASIPPGALARVTLVQSLPAAVPADVVRRPVRLFADTATGDGLFADARVISGAGFVGVDAAAAQDDAALAEYLQRFIREQMKEAEFHPDAWPVVVIRDPNETSARLAAAAGDQYT